MNAIRAVTGGWKLVLLWPLVWVNVCVRTSVYFIHILEEEEKRNLLLIWESDPDVPLFPSTLLPPRTP